MENEMSKMREDFSVGSIANARCCKAKYDEDNFRFEQITASFVI
jgi:hypothetical protein